jgi:NADH-quinone oxidoreductase subunit E
MKSDLQHKIEFSKNTLQKIEELVSHYPKDRQKSAIIPILHIVQEENAGWLSTAAMDSVAEVLQIQPIEVYEVATFYSQFNLEPTGKHILEVCRTGPCCMIGAEKLITHLETKLGIKCGETTPDGMFTLKPVECLGACGYGPVIQIGEKYYEHLDIQKTDELLEKLKNKTTE